LEASSDIKIFYIQNHRTGILRKEEFDVLNTLLRLKFGDQHAKKLSHTYHNHYLCTEHTSASDEQLLHAFLI
jgi:hypothetical protein